MKTATKFYMHTRKKRSCASHSKLSVVTVTCSVLVWTGDNKHAHCFRPDSEMSDGTQTQSQIKKKKKQKTRQEMSMFNLPEIKRVFLSPVQFLSEQATITILSLQIWDVRLDWKNKNAVKEWWREGNAQAVLRPSQFMRLQWVMCCTSCWPG